MATLPTTSAGGDFGDSGSRHCSRLDRRVAASLCGRGAEVAMRGRIHQSVVFKKHFPCFRRLVTFRGMTGDSEATRQVIFRRITSDGFGYGRRAA